MAFPSTISTLVSTPYLNVGGPYVSSAGNVYVLTRSSIVNELHMFKATDPSSAWGAAGVDFGVTSGNGIRQIAACQVGDNIHVVTRDGDVLTNNVLQYHVFSMASDGWTVSNETIRSAYETAWPDIEDTPVDIMVRSNGDVIVLYEGPTVTADIKRSRVYYARRLSGTWSADFALDLGGNAHWIPGGLVKGSNDRTHFFFHDITNADAYQRTLDSANALEALSATFALDTQILPSGDAMAQRGVAYSASAGGTFIRFPYYNSFSPDLNDAKFSSSATPTASVVTNITGATIVTSGAARHVISEAADEATAYAVFINTDFNLYLMSNADDAGWSAPTFLLDAVSASEVFTNIYTRNSAKVIGIVYQDTTNLKYTEYTLSSSVVVSPSLVFGRMMMGMGR